MENCDASHSSIYLIEFCDSVELLYLGVCGGWWCFSDDSASDNQLGAQSKAADLGLSLTWDMIASFTGGCGSAD